VAIAVNLGTNVFITSACAAPRTCAGGIFADTARLGSVDPGTRPTVRRQRRVEIDVARIRQPRDELTLNLFPDTCVIARRERVTELRPGVMQWEGRVAGAPPGTVTLIVDGEVVVGTIRVGSELYEIRYLGEGVHVVNDVDASKFPRD